MCIHKTESEICKQLKAVGRILEQEEYYIWCCSPIYDDDGRVHIFYARWESKFGFYAWLYNSEIAHAVADSPEGPYTFVDVALSGRGAGFWDSWSVFNPSIYKIDGKYVMLYIGIDGTNSDKTSEELNAVPLSAQQPCRNKILFTQRVGIAVADSLIGPWVRSDAFLIDVGASGEWDDLITTNPGFVKTKEGKYRVYYKAMNSEEYMKFGGNRRYGFAESDSLFGEYVKFEGNPVIDNSKFGERVQIEDGYFWNEDGKYKVIMCDMGLFDPLQRNGLYYESDDGIFWGDAQMGYYEASRYFDEPLPNLPRQGKLERPQILFKDGKPQYLFCAYMGGKYHKSTAAVLKFERN